MRSRILIPIASLLLFASVAPARAEGRWSLGLLAGMSASQNHGSAVDARLLAQANPRLGLGVETGLAYMNDVAINPPIYRTATSEPEQALASVTDGITRNSAYYLGPAIKAGDALYAIASMGRYQFTNNVGHTTPTRWGWSAGLGISGRSHFAPTAEMRYRWSPTSTRNASAVMFTMGFQFQ